MDKLKEFLRNNVKLVSAIIVILVGLAGVKLAPETADKIAGVVVELVAPESQAPNDGGVVKVPVAPTVNEQ